MSGGMFVNEERHIFGGTGFLPLIHGLTDKLDAQTISQDQMGGCIRPMTILIPKMLRYYPYSAFWPLKKKKKRSLKK